MRHSYNSSAETGRFYVHSARTGRVYCVEPIEPRQRDAQTQWGDVDPATRTVTGSYGHKYTGAIRPEDSIITAENGYHDIHHLEPGVSPLSYIEQLDDALFAKMNTKT
ncbi:MAG: hypothetical protein JSS76_13435 [Bacteroidetes bacterium]|nr:hypothetical protein [Bacteroidota bacterium]